LTFCQISPATDRAQAALAELVTGIQRGGQVAAVRRTVMATGGRAEHDLPVHVVASQL
jgi:hypothetical protein